MHTYFIPTTDLKRGTFVWIGSRLVILGAIWHLRTVYHDYNHGLVLLLLLMSPWYVTKLEQITPATPWTKHSHVPVRKYRCSTPLFSMLALSIFNICSAPHVYTYTLGAEACQA